MSGPKPDPDTPIEKRNDLDDSSIAVPPFSGPSTDESLRLVREEQKAKRERERSN